MAAKIMIARNNRNVDSHSFEFLMLAAQSTSEFAGRDYIQPSIPPIKLKNALRARSNDLICSQCPPCQSAHLLVPQKSELGYACAVQRNRSLRSSRLIPLVR